MVVDDDDGLCDAIRDILHDDYAVASVPHGAAALELVRAHEPVLILLDLRMPVMDGADAIPAIRERSPDTRIVVFTADQTAEVEGVDAQVIKGASMAEVLSSLAEAPSRR